MAACVQIVKVLHGADKDIQWLQRDFGLYMANMFDTGQASRVLEYSGHGLGYLLQHFCQVKVSPLPCPAHLCCVYPPPPAPLTPYRMPSTKLQALLPMLPADVPSVSTAQA